MRSPEKPSIKHFIATVLGGTVIFGISLSGGSEPVEPASFSDNLSSSNSDTEFLEAQRPPVLSPEGVFISPLNPRTDTSFHSSWTREKVKWAIEEFQSPGPGPHQTPYQPR